MSECSEKLVFSLDIVKKQANNTITTCLPALANMFWEFFCLHLGKKQHYVYLFNYFSIFVPHLLQLDTVIMQSCCSQCLYVRIIINNRFIALYSQYITLTEVWAWNAENFGCKIYLTSVTWTSTEPWAIMNPFHLLVRIQLMSTNL